MSDSEPIGQVLIRQGLISESQLEHALATQRREGGMLGRHLILEGAVSRRDMYSALAEQWDAPLVDLIAEPIDDDLLVGLTYEDIIARGWAPWRRVGDSVVIVTTVPPSVEVADEVVEKFDARASFRTTTDWDLTQDVQRHFRAGLRYLAESRLAEERPAESARSSLNWWQVTAPVVVAVCFTIALMVSMREAFIVVIFAANVAFFVSITFKSVAGIRAPLRRARLERERLEILNERERRGLAPTWRGRVDDSDLPVYSILVPAFHEAGIVEKLVANLGALDYPKAKLDVLLLLEESDHETIAVAKSMNPPEFVRIVVVPAGEPQTKPRACNYGLAFCRGKYVVIFDAEDRPDPEQLRIAVDAFELDVFERQYIDPQRDPLVCVQASLSYFNADYNVLTRMFAIEYAHWFDAMLPGLNESGIPLPLGGTSNHFDTQALRELGGWDPYNVTEDADLGLRAAVEGYRVSVIDSATLEEACSRTGAWVKQRTRWIKGYMITAAVNTRRPVRYARRTGFMGVVGLVGLIIGTPMAFLAYPLALGFTIVTYVGVQFIGLNLPNWLIVMGIVCMGIGNVMMILASGWAATKRYNWRIGIFALLNPIYWILHSVAAWRAAWQTAVKPHTWEKTPHGLTEEYESNAHL